MQITLLWIGVFIVSLSVLIKAADYFTESSEKIGLAFRIPTFIVGGTIVAFGTSLPELVSSLIATLDGATEIVVGNVVGSNITNIALILGIAVLYTKKVHIDRELISVDLPILFGSSIFLAFSIIDGKFTLSEAFVFLGGLVLYIFYILKDQHREHTPIERKVKKDVEHGRVKPMTIFTLVASGVAVWVGAKYTIESVTMLSQILNVGTDKIALFAIALGTSLPELAVTVSAVKSGKGEMAVGNILGSNIFNTFAVMGIPALFGSLIIPTDIIVFYLPFMFTLTLLFFFMAQDKKFSRWEGVLLVLFYVFYLIKLAGI